MKIVSPEQMREIDRTAIEELGIPGRKLMERAGRAVADRVLGMLGPDLEQKNVILLAGKGNNGGDALVAARLLEDEGIKTRTYLLGRPTEIKGDASANLGRLFRNRAILVELTEDQELKDLRENLSDADLIVDGIFGTGFRGKAEGIAATVIELINRTPTPVVAIDIPSGLGGEFGEVGGIAVRAAVTVTMGLAKTGLVRGEGLKYAGRIEIADIGFPPEAIDPVAAELELLTPAELAGCLSPRSPVDHKGVYGRLLILAGSPGMTGAACLTATAALRAGAGLVTVGLPESLNSILEVKCTEAMTVPLAETSRRTLAPAARPAIESFLKNADLAALGPGLSQNPETGKLIRELIRDCPLPLVIDADGLNLLAEDTEVLTGAKAPRILTPHPGEMSRLTGLSPAEILRDREGIAQSFARKYDCVLVLKGAGTIVAGPEGPPAVNITGNPGMATGGTGDVLTGLIAGFLAQGVEPVAAARLGVYVHGAAGDRAAEKVGQISLIASDCIEAVPPILKNLFQ